jgi:hypothetical protein
MEPDSRWAHRLTGLIEPVNKKRDIALPLTSPREERGEVVVSVAAESFLLVLHGERVPAGG